MMFFFNHKGTKNAQGFLFIFMGIHGFDGLDRFSRIYGRRNVIVVCVLNFTYSKSICQFCKNYVILSIIHRNTPNSRNSFTVTVGGISLLRIFLITNSATFIASSSLAKPILPGSPGREG